MSIKYKDLTGSNFGYLKVIERADDVFTRDGRKRVVWKCECRCGNTIDVFHSDLLNAIHRSCGCVELPKLPRLQRGRTTGFPFRIKRVWRGMMDRCYKENNPSYYNYGGRGINVCEEWHDFDAFKDWAFRHGYDEYADRGKCTLDRIDVDGNYSPDNCRWVDMKKQSENKRNTISLKYKRKTRLLTEWAEITGISYSTLYYRVKQGKSPEEVLRKP